MLPHLFYLPVIVVAVMLGLLIGSAVFSSLKRTALTALAAVLCAAGAGLYAAHSQWAGNSIPVQGYGVMILLGVICGVIMAARRAPLIGVEPRQCLDVGIFGVCVGLLGARLMHIVLNWHNFDPSIHGSAGVVNMFKLWEGGLVFYGGFITALPAAWFYCKYYGIPPIPFLDMSVPSLIAGQAFGRIGCFLNGCCYGRTCDLPWAVRFPVESIPGPFSRHPTQIYASIAAALTAAFLYAYWPRRQYDGQILSLMLIMAGTTRFFEESLRADDVAAFPALSSWMTIAQWIAMLIFFSGTGLLFYFRNRQTCFKPPALSVS